MGDPPGNFRFCWHLSPSSPRPPPPADRVQSFQTLFVSIKWLWPTEAKQKHFKMSTADKLKPQTTRVQFFILDLKFEKIWQKISKLGNCKICVKQKISFSYETKRDEILLKLKCKMRENFCLILLNVIEILHVSDLALIQSYAEIRMLWMTVASFNWRKRPA
jgi:hypothetical protein